jgi:putative phage-type endonuclease
MYSAAEFLKNYEDINPLPTNLAFYHVWEKEAEDLWDIQVEEGHDTLDAILSFRRKFLEESFINPITQTPKDSWKWLLTAKQVEQRTSEWYKETRNIITASEVSAIWKSPRARAALIMSKVKEQEVSVKRNSAFPRDKTGPMDWGVRYEPVVKQILETTLGAKILDLGRIRHRNNQRIAASPDGLFTESLVVPALAGTLVEIKCPPTRKINDKIPFDYWCQMQLQMEVCDRPSCEFVEVKFKELDEHTPSTVTDPALHGWIILEGNQDTMEMRYIYSDKPTGDEGWVVMEKYQWEVVQFRRVTLLRDPVWFEKSQADFELFWKDVEAARAGTWFPPPPLRAKKEAAPQGICAIVDSDLEKEENRPALWDQRAPEGQEGQEGQGAQGGQSQVPSDECSAIPVTTS